MAKPFSALPIEFGKRTLSMQGNFPQKYFVYFNLHKKLWSVKNMKTGRVEFHAERVLLKECVFRVGERGRQRVIREKRKNVHAGVVGYLTNWKEMMDYKTFYHDFESKDLQRPWQSARYNPYLRGEFWNEWTGKPVHKAEFVELSSGCNFLY